MSVNANINPTLIAELFESVQENATPALWSQGVTLTRGGSQFVVSSLGADECVVHVRTPGKPLSPKVRLWPNDMDWDCDCNEDSPCSHVAAAVILLKRGELKASVAGSTAAAANVPLLNYHFVRTSGGLALERRLGTPGGKYRLLEGSLISYTSGVAAKRIDGPEILASKTDHAIDQVLRGYRSGTAVERARLETLFKTFSAEQKLFLDDEPVQTSDSRLAAQYECVDEADGYRLRRLINPLVTEVFPAGVALCTGGILRLLNPKLLNAEESKLVDGEGSFWPANKENALFSQVLPQLQKKISVTVSSLKRPQSLEIPPLVHLLMEKELSGGGSTLSVLANIVYGDPPMAQLNPATLELSAVHTYRGGGARPVIVRQQNAERQLIQKLARELNLQIGRRIELVGEEAIVFARKAKEWNPEGDGLAAFTPENRVLTADIKVHEHGTGSQYLLSASFSSQSDEGVQTDAADFAQVFQAWQQGREHVSLMDGSWAKIPRDWMQKHAKRIQEFLAAREAGRDAIPAHRLPELGKLCEELDAPHPESLKKLRGLLEDFREIGDANLPSDLTATLRPYQKRGVAWLSFLREAGLGAMLADDMGLGKTLQMLCAIRGRTLIVAPTSVLFNWAQEIKKFRPQLRVCIYYGAGRALDNDADVVLTTYGLLRLDQGILGNNVWESIVLDEAQTIKNPDSQVAKAAHALRGNFRAALSGTPVENRLDDLWSQFAFLNPGFLGTRSDFADKYARPIASGDAQAAKDLRGRLKPFILRRLKREVAPELPPRTEVVLRCELSSDERATYESLLASTRKEVLATLEGGGSIMKALEVILRLRQACCHQALIPGVRADSSSKVDLLMETLDESLQEGHKSLIFSQWTSFLDLISAELQKRGIRHSRIDGSTAHRQELVNEFQSTDGPPIMLISLKAGGVGLTLTAADHVFITDPWWNPAAEDQAADRAHRIGQTNPVIIHRLVATESIEERILALQEAKKDLARSVLEDGGAAASLTRDDLLKLLL